jgi:Zn-dependent peptidase ImmA (M78 family)
MPKVNPEILIWARETAGLSSEEASKALGIKEAYSRTSVERLERLEKGVEEPSRSVLKKMAEKYRRPLILFYMEDTPHQGDRGKDFRQLPEEYSGKDDALVDAMIRQIRSRQSALRDILEDDEEIKPLDFIGSASIENNIDAVASSIKEKINFNIEEYYSKENNSEAFNYLRKKVADAGIFVLLISNLGNYHSSFEVNFFRGYSISDSIAPFVVINGNDSRAAWSFTLLHEITLLWLGLTGISNQYNDTQIEKFCNSVAGELLLPSRILESINLSEKMDFEELRREISHFAISLNISSSMVAYKLFIRGIIDKPTWDQLNTVFRNLWLESEKKKKQKQKKQDGGPTYYTMKKYQLGNHIISYVQEFTLEGSITISKAGRILGVSPKNVHTLFEQFNQAKL